MTTTFIRMIASTALILGAMTQGTLPAAAETQRGAPAPRVAQANPQLQRCIQFSHRAHNTCLNTARGNPDLRRQCRYRLQQNVIGCRSRYR